MGKLDTTFGNGQNGTDGLVWAMALQAEVGQVQEATQLLKRLKAMVSEGRFPAQGYLMATYAVAMPSGDVKTGESALSGIMKIVNDPKTASQDLFYLTTELVPVLVRHGQIEPAFAILSRCNLSGLPPPYDMLMLNPLLEPLRVDPRFKEIVERSRSQFHEMLEVLKEAKSRGQLPAYLEAPRADLVKKLGVT